MLGPPPVFGPGPLSPIYNGGGCGSGGDGGPINHNLGPSGWGNGGSPMTPSYNIGRPLNHYLEAIHYTPALAAPPIEHPVYVIPTPKLAPLVDPYWRADLLPSCGDALCHLNDIPCNLLSFIK